jgi:acyl dehydratase
MPLNAKAIEAYSFGTQEQCFDDRDAMLYALSIGVGRDPLDRDELPYVYEENLKTFPTMAVVLGHPGPWMNDPSLGINQQMLVHGTQRLEVLGELRPGAPFVASNRVLELVDKGPDVGGVIVMERTLRDAATGGVIARMESGIFCRADGGFGGRREASREFRVVPAREPDAVVDMPTDPNQALWYRLNGDRNPLHASPDFAAKAKFKQPILHGLCTFAVAAHGLTQLQADAGLKSIEARFSKPVFPGETVRVESWKEPDGVAFRARICDRDVVVLDRGFAEFG